MKAPNLCPRGDDGYDTIRAGTMKEKQTLIQNLTFMALMAAINTVFCLVALFFPLASLFLTLALLMASVLVALTCKEKYYPIYAVATLGLGLVVTINGIETTLFYLIPALISGFFFGFLIKRKWFAGFVVLGVSWIQLGLTYLTMLLIQGLFETDMTLVFSTLLNLSSSPYGEVIMPSFFFVIALAQTAFSFIMIQSEIKKFGFEIKTEENRTWLFPVISLGLFPLIVGFAFFLPSVSYLLLSVFVYFSLLSLVSLWPYKTQKWLAFVGVCELLTLFLFAALFDWVPSPLSLLLVGLFFLPTDVLAFITFCLKRHTKTIK